MRTIIKKGTRKQLTCSKCGCLFSYEEEDIQHLEYENGAYTFVEGTKHGYKNYVMCPQCDYDNAIEKTKGLSEKEVKR